MSQGGLVLRVPAVYPAVILYVARRLSLGAKHNINNILATDKQQHQQHISTPVLRTNYLALLYTWYKQYVWAGEQETPIIRVRTYDINTYSEL